MKTHLVGILILVVCLVGAFGVSYFLPHGVARESTLEAQAQAMVRKCANTTYPPACYDEQIPRLMDRGLSMEEAFEVTRMVQDTTDGYFYCHVLSHRLAEKEVAKDPGAWTEVIGRCPAGICSNGCLHGAAQERFRAESLTPDEVEHAVPELLDLCEPANGLGFTELERASCYHALGHLSMYLSGGDVAVAVGMCDKVAGRRGINYDVTCYEGAFMQIFQPLEPEDVALVKDIPVATKEEALAFCGTFSGDLLYACHRESRALYGLIDTGEKIEAFCSQIPGDIPQRDCYLAVIYAFVPYLDFGVGRVVSVCDGVPEKRAAQCFANAAGRFVETDYRLSDEAAALCAAAAERGVGDRCYRELVYMSAFAFREGSVGFTALCGALPEPWKGRCFNGDGKHMELFYGEAF